MLFIQATLLCNFSFLRLGNDLLVAKQLLSSLILGCLPALDTETDLLGKFTMAEVSALVLLKFAHFLLNSIFLRLW